MMGSVSAMDTRPNDVAREKGMATQQTPPGTWPLAALEGHMEISYLQCNVQLVDEDGSKVADDADGANSKAVTGQCGLAW